MSSYPGYVAKLKGGKLERIAGELMSLLKDCTVCPRHCHVNRLKGEKGFCQAGLQVEIGGYGPHFGEEPPLVGRGGSGTIFFSHCNLRCVFCQNYEISRGLEGETISCEELAQLMLMLQEKGCHNINLVTPSHYVPQIVSALALAASRGLSLPLVYNCGGYEEVETLKALEGLVDIYMPDFKYASGEASQKLSGASDYPEVAKKAIKEMHRQVGDLEINEEGIAVKGLIIRHLILPGGLAGTEEVLQFIAQEISPRTYINLMDQYYPAGEAFAHPYLARRINPFEYAEALRLARRISPHFRLA